MEAKEIPKSCLWIANPFSQNISNSNSIWISVAGLPDDNENQFVRDYGVPAARALTSADGQGVILQYDEHLIELQCQVSGCSWTILQQKLRQSVRGAVVFALPEEYTCEWWS